MTEILFGYPLHLQSIGDVTYDNSLVDTDSLIGVHLDFYYCIATQNFEIVAMHFLPEGSPYQIKVNSENGLVAFERDVDEIQMRKIVKSEFGNQVKEFKMRL